MWHLELRHQLEDLTAMALIDSAKRAKRPHGHHRVLAIREAQRNDLDRHGLLFTLGVMVDDDVVAGRQIIVIPAHAEGVEEFWPCVIGRNNDTFAVGNGGLDSSRNLPQANLAHEWSSGVKVSPPYQWCWSLQARQALLTWLNS